METLEMVEKQVGYPCRKTGEGNCNVYGFLDNDILLMITYYLKKI